MSVASRAGTSTLFEYLVNDLGMTSSGINDCLYEYYTAQGHSGTLTDMEYSYLGDAGYTQANINDRWYEYLGDKGYTGTIWDRFHQSIVAGDLLGGAVACWILASGIWDDTCTWIDTEHWIDGLSEAWILATGFWVDSGQWVDGDLWID